MPSPGLVRALSVPGGPGIRDDRGVAPGFEIPVFYDSMIAKLIVSGDTRPDAIARLTRVLAEYRVVGVTTTVPFFQWLVGQPEFLAGEFDTTYLDRILAERKGRPFVEPTETDERDAAVAAGLAAGCARIGRRPGTASRTPAAPGGARRGRRASGAAADCRVRRADGQATAERTHSLPLSK